MTSIYGGLRIKIIDSHSDPLVFKCSAGDPLFVLNNSNNKSAELRIKNKLGNYVSLQPDDDTEQSFSLILPKDVGSSGNLLYGDGTGKINWTDFRITPTAIIHPNKFSIETQNGITSVFFGNSEDTTEGTWKIESGDSLSMLRFEDDTWVTKFSLDG